MEKQYAKLSYLFLILRNYWVTVVAMTPYLMDNTTVSYGRFLILLNLMCARTKGFFLSGTELSLNKVNSGNLIKHWSLNWTQSKDCSPTQEVAGLSPFVNDKYFKKTFGKTPMFITKRNPRWASVTFMYNLGFRESDFDRSRQFLRNFQSFNFTDKDHLK